MQGATQDRFGKWLTVASIKTQTQNRKGQTMQEYEFTLKFDLRDSNADPAQYLDELYEKGCDDALIGVGKKGYVSLNFIREALSAADAIYSAISNVKAVVPNAILIEATPDLVGLTDIAEISGFTRQHVRKLACSKENLFPTPMHEGNPSLWHLADVLVWLQQNKDYPTDEAMLETAQVNLSLNILNRVEKLSDKQQEKFRELVAA